MHATAGALEAVEWAEERAEVLREAVAAVDSGVETLREADSQVEVRVEQQQRPAAASSTVFWECRRTKE